MIFSFIFFFPDPYPTLPGTLPGTHPHSQKSVAPEKELLSPSENFSKFYWAESMSDYREKIEAIRQEQLHRCVEDIEYFIDNYGHIEDKDADELIQPFEMWKEQREALHSLMSHKLNVVLKARQLGFSWLVMHIAAHTLLSPGKTVIGLSKTEEEAKELVRRLKTIFTWCPELIEDKEFLTPTWQGITFKATALTLTVFFPDGKESVFKALASSPGAGRSFTANLIVFDEWAFQQFAREIWQAGFPTINRPSGGKVIGLSTIERGSLFEEIFTDPDNGFNKIFIPWYADPRRNEEWYKKTKRALGDLIYAEYPATIDEALMVPGGAYFPEVTKDTHETEEEPQGKVRRYVSIDYGLDCFAAIWYTLDIFQHAQAYRECSQPNLTISEAAEMLHYLSAGEHIDMYLAPPDLWNRRQETGKSVADIFNEHGIILVKTSNDIFNGCMMMKEWLRVPDNGNPDLTFLKDTCPETIKCLQKIQKDKNKPKIYAKQPHDLTHLVDSLRAFCIYWTKAPRADKKEDKRPKWSEDLIEDWKRASKEIKALMVQQLGEPRL